MSKFGRNDPCPCGSGKKYKKCCLAKDQSIAANAAAAALAEEEAAPDVGAAADELLGQMESGAGQAVGPELFALLAEYPNHPIVLYAMGVYHGMVLAESALAVDYFKRAVAIRPAFAEAHYNLGGAARQMGEIPQAIEAYRAAMRYSHSEDGVAALARRELQIIEIALLKTTPFRTLDAFLANSRLFEEAFGCLAAQQYERAIDLFQRVLAENPTHVQSHGNLGLAHAGLGQRSAALACLDRALELDPDYEPAQQNRANLLNLREGESFDKDQFRETRYYPEKFFQKK